MYAMVVAIAAAATSVLLHAIDAKGKKRLWLWVLYAVLIALGMWTHYFAALVWLAHWVWRGVIIWQDKHHFKPWLKAFFSREWLYVHILAIAIFIPWIPSMLKQLTIVQDGGFWIGMVGPHSLTSVWTYGLLYQDATGGRIQPWGTAVVAAIVVIAISLALKLYRTLGRAQRRSYLLILSLFIVPVVLLFVASLPPIKQPSYVERYILTAFWAFALFLGVTLALGGKHLHKIWRGIFITLVAGAMIFGIGQVYTYGNYNDNSHTNTQTKAQVEAAASHSTPGEPIIAASPWTYYEAVFYSTPAHPIYFLDSSTKYEYGSLLMLKENDIGKIKDLAAFTKDHPKVWYIGFFDGDITPPVKDWKQLQEITIHDQIDGKDRFKAAEYDTTGVQ
jgi:hypothetical protein